MYKRRLKSKIDSSLERGKSLLVLGPRQVGKTTLLEHEGHDLSISLLLEKNRIKYERNPDFLLHEIEALTSKKMLRVFIDEIQLCPRLLNTCQHIVDKKMAQLILTGSSARKLRKHADINLLPGRIVLLHLDALSYTEHKSKNIEEILLYGELPGIMLTKRSVDKSSDLESYVITYLEEEIRKEAATKNLPAFYRFLEMAALESGKIVSFRSISQEIGVGHTTVSSYYEILEDSLVALRIDPYSQSTTRKKLTKSSKYLFFDMGVRRLAAKEGAELGRNRMGELFEHYVGLEIHRLLQFQSDRPSLNFWRDPDGPEVDWLIRAKNKLIPIEVKYRENVDLEDCRHLNVFLDEYKNAPEGYVVCLADRPYKISKKISAIPWTQIEKILI